MKRTSAKISRETAEAHKAESTLIRERTNKYYNSDVLPEAREEKS